MFIDTDQLLSIKAIAELLGKSPQLVRHHSVKNNIPEPIDICGQRFYTRESVEQWQATGRRKR